MDQHVLAALGFAAHHFIQHMHFFSLAIFCFTLALQGAA
jgi:hypothetical protein